MLWLWTFFLDSFNWNLEQWYSTELWCKLSMSIDNSHTYGNTSIRDYILKDDLLYNELIKKHNKNNNILLYIDFVFSTPWQNFLNPHIEAWIFHQLAADLERIDDMTMLTKVFFKKLVFFYELLYVILLKIFNECLFNNDLLLYVYFNNFNKESIFSYGMNLNTDLDLYYNTLLELLYENNGYNYGLSHDIILNKSTYLWDSNHIKDINKNYSVNFNRYSLNYLHDMCDSNYDFFNRIDRIKTKKIGYRTNITWENFIRVYKTRKWKEDSFFLWYGKDNIIINNIFVNNLLIKYLQNNFLNIGITSSVFWPISSKLLINYIPTTLTGNGFNSVKELRFFGGYSPWFYYYNDDLPYAPARQFVSNKREVYTWIFKYRLPRIRWGWYYDKNFWQRMGLEFVAPWQKPTGAWRRGFLGFSKFKYKFTWFDKYRRPFKYLPYTLSRAWDDVIWRNFRSYLWYDDVFMHNIALRDLALKTKKALSKSVFEAYNNMRWYQDIPYIRRTGLFGRAHMIHKDIDYLFAVSDYYRNRGKPRTLPDRIYMLLATGSHYQYQAFWKLGDTTASDYVDYKFYLKNNLEIIHGDFLIKRIVKKLPASLRDWDCYYQRRRWSNLENTPSDRLKFKKRRYFKERFRYKKRGDLSGMKRYLNIFKITSLYPRWILRFEAFYVQEKPFIYSIKPTLKGVRNSFLKNLQLDESPIYKDNIRITRNTWILDKRFKDILILSKKAMKLIQESGFYSKKSQKMIQSAWIRNYVKNVVFGTDMHYFLEEKGIKNNIFFNKKYYTSIKSVSGDVLANIINKKYWTFNDRTAESTYVMNTFINSNNNDSFFDKNFYPNFKHKSDFFKNKFYKNKQIFFFKSYFYEKYCDLNMLKYHYIFHKYNDISTYLNHMDQKGFLPILDGKNFNEIFSWLNNKNKWVFYNFLKKHNIYMRLFQFHDLTKDNFKIQVSNSFWSLQYFLQLLPFFGWSVLSNFLHKGLDTSDSISLDTQLLHIFDYENMFDLKSWAFQNRYIQNIQEEVEIVKKFDFGVKNFYNLYKSINNLKVDEPGVYRGRTRSVRKNYIFELGPYNWLGVFKQFSADEEYENEYPYLLNMFKIIFYNETNIRGHDSTNIRRGYDNDSTIKYRFYPFNTKLHRGIVADIINKGVISAMNPIYPYDDKVDVIFPNRYMVKSRWLFPHFFNIFCVNDFIRYDRDFCWHHYPEDDDWIGFDYMDSMLDEYKKYTLGGLPACRHDDYAFLYPVYDRAFKRFFFFMHLSDFMDITSEKLIKIQYNIAYERLWFDNHFAAEHSALTNVFSREKANVVFKKWWSDNKISFWYFLYPLLNKSLNVFIDYINIIHLPKKQAYNLFYNSGYITSNANEETKKYSLKQEYLPIFGNSFELEKAIYYKYFFIKDRKRYLFSFINETIMYINDCITIAITDYITISNYLEKNIYFKIFVYFSITLIILLFYTFFSWIILNIIKTEFPLNNIYGVKVNIERKDSLKVNTQEEKKKNWKEFITDDLKWILNEDITFGTESKFIYSLNDREKFWLKERVYNKHVANLNSKVRTNYDIFYKKFSFDENFKFLETSWRIKIDYDRIRDFWIIFKESLSWFIVGRLVIRLFNDRLFNFGRFIKQENPKLSFTLSEFIARLPKSVVWKPVFNFLRLVIGSVFIWFGIKIRHGLRAFRSDWYYLFFKNSLVLDQIKKEELHAELDRFFKKLDASGTFNWYRENMDYFYHEVIQKDFSEANKEFFYLSKESHWDFHMFIWNYYNNFRIKEDTTEKQVKEEAEKVNENYYSDNFFMQEDSLPFKGKEQLEMEKKLRSRKGWENLFSLYSEKLNYYVDCDNKLKDYAILNTYSKKRFSKLNFNVEDTIKEQFRFKVKCIDYLIFNTLLTLIDDQNIQNILKQKIKDLSSVNFEKQLDDIEWIVKAIGSNNIYYNNKTSTKDYWLNVLGWRQDLLKEAYNQNLFEERLQAAKTFKQRQALIDDEKRAIKERSSRIFDKHEERFTIFRFYNTIGSRFYYLLTLIIDVSIIWADYIKKIRWNSKDLPTLAQIFIFNIKKYWKKIFWQYVFLFNKEKIFKNLKIKIKDVFIFTVWVVSPLCLYFTFLIFIYIIVYLLWSFFQFFSNIFRLNKLKLLLFYNKHFTILFPVRLIYKLVKILLKSINFLITDIKTGDTIFDSLYNYLHYLLGKIQVFFFYIQGAYKLGKQEKNVLTGIIYICKWIYLKLRVSFEKKILWITICNKIKMNKTTRIKDLFKAPINLGFLKFKLLFQLLKFDRDFLFIFLFVNEFIQGIIIFFVIYLWEHYERYTILLLYQFLVLKVENFFKFYNDELIPFFYSSKEEKIKTLINVFIKKPIKFLIKNSITLRITYVSRTWKDKISIFNWNSKIDEAIRNGSWSYYFQLKRRFDEPWPLEIYVEKRAMAYEYHAEFETEFAMELLGTLARWLDPKKHNWEAFYKLCRRVKLKLLLESELLMRRIEREYRKYDKKVYLRKISPIKRIIKIIYQLWHEHIHSPDKLFMAKDDARDRFFNKKWKERQKFVFRYFIKGLINWICYITFKKVIFTKIVELEEQLFVVRYQKYRQYRNLIPRLSSNLYFVSNLEKIPPQLWLLAILYELYYHGIVFYIYDENRNYYHREYLTPPKNARVKRRIKLTFGRVSVIPLVFILQTYVNFEPSAFWTVSKRKVIDLLSVYIIYALERLSKETFDTKNESWFDISSKYAEFYFVNPDIPPFVDDGFLPFEGKEILDTDDKIRGIDKFTTFDKEPHFIQVLLNELTELRLKKSALQLKLSFQSMAEDNASDLPLKRDVHESEKKEIFDIYGVPYDEYLGRRFWVDVEDRFETRWNYNMHIIQFSIMEGFYFANAKNISQIYNHVTTIYYELTLKELINQIKNVLSIKNKCIKYINVTPSPTLFYNLNYSNYLNYEGVAQSEKNNLDDYTKMIYKDLKKTWTKKIKYARNESIDWVLRIGTYEDIYSDSMQNTTMGDLYYYFPSNTRSYLENRHDNFYESKKQKEPYFAHKIIINRLDIVSVWNTRISKRFISEDLFKYNMEQYLLDFFFVNPRRDEKQLEKPLFFFNIAKFSWTQWVGFDLIEAERLKFLKRNTIIIHELYNIWNLKLEPLRVKLPIVLGLSDDKLKEFFVNLKSFLGQLAVKSFYLPWNRFYQLTVNSLIWREFQDYVYDLTGIKKEEILMWWMSNDTPQFKKLSKLYRDGIRVLAFDMIWPSQSSISLNIHFSWDILQFYKIWEEYAEDFEYQEWYMMRLNAYSRVDIEVLELQDDFIFIQYRIFNPTLFHFFFNQQRFIIWRRKYIGIFCSLVVFYEIFYCPGEYLYNIWFVVVPLVVGIFNFLNYFYLRKYLKEDLKGRDFYLYKYQSQNRRPLSKKMRGWWNYDQEAWEKIQEELGYDGKEVKWQSNSSKYIKNRLLTVSSIMPYLNVLVLTWFCVHFRELQMWRLDIFRGWDYYYRHRHVNDFSIRSFQEKVWIFYHDDRNEGGGTIQNLWYMNIYRRKKNIPEVPIWGNYKEFEPVPTRRLDLRFRSPSTGDYYTLNLDLSYYELIFYPYSIQVRKLRDLLAKELSIKDGVMDWLTMLRYRAEVISNMYKYAGQKNTKARLRKYLKRWRREQKEELLETLRELGPTFDEVSNKTFMIVRKLVAHDNFRYVNRHYAILSKKREMFHSGEQLYYNILLNLTKYEKHFTIFYYNLMKYKFQRNYYNNKSFFPEFDTIEKKTLYLMRHDFNYLINEGSRMVHVDWARHVVKMAKLKQYIKNFDLTTNKLQLIQKLWEKKINTTMDIFDKIIDFISLFYSWLNYKEILDILSIIIKFFF